VWTPSGPWRRPGFIPRSEPRSLGSPTPRRAFGKAPGKPPEAQALPDPWGRGGRRDPAKQRQQADAGDGWARPSHRRAGGPCAGGRDAGGRSGSLDGAGGCVRGPRCGPPTRAMRAEPFGTTGPASPTAAIDTAADAGRTRRLAAPAGGSNELSAGRVFFAASGCAMSVPGKSIGLSWSLLSSSRPGRILKGLLVCDLRSVRNHVTS